MLGKMAPDRLLSEGLALVRLIVRSAVQGCRVPNPLHPRQLPLHGVVKLFIRRPEVALVELRQGQVGGVVRTGTVELFGQLPREGKETAAMRKPNLDSQEAGKRLLALCRRDRFAVHQAPQRGRYLKGKKSRDRERLPGALPVRQQGRGLRTERPKDERPHNDVGINAHR
jgi:hypothetical protein